jgi:G:T/U-mismatch repair DNA glycosylase
LHLVEQAGEEEAMKQVQALPFRSCRDRAAVLVKSIRERWDAPSECLKQQEQQQRAAVHAEKQRQSAIVASYRAKCRGELLSRLSGLPAAQKLALEARAVALYRHEQPAAARLMLGRSVGASVVQDYMLRLFAEEGGFNQN